MRAPLAVTLLALAFGGAAAARATPPRVAHSAATAPRVDVLVAGRHRVLGPALTLRVPAATVRVGRRGCAVAAGTAVAALAALRRHGGPAFVLRDYGSCSSRTADAAQLYVRQIGPDRAGGPNGWVYKVDRATPGIGAADPAGRVRRSGHRLTWFFCRMGAHGCQRTLELSAPGAVARGDSLRVAVRGYDDHGRGVAVAGAQVVLAGRSALTGADGSATLTAPTAAGSYAVTAQRSGMVAAFPRRVTVS